MERKTEFIHNNSVAFAYYGDDYVAHYMLSGERFKHSDELLTLLLHHRGACMEDPKMYARTECNFDCCNCERSIYHQVAMKEKFFNARCRDLCNRVPKVGDEWEVSIHMLSDHPHFEVFFFHCVRPNNDEEKTIAQISYETMMKWRPTFLQAAKYCYVKVRRNDIAKAMDVSIVANQIFKELQSSEK